MDEEIIKELNAKLHPDNVKKHPFTNMDYIEGWKAIEEANRIFNFDWHRETIYCREIACYEKEIGKNKDAGWLVGYEAKVRIRVGDIEREGTGHGSGIAKDLFDCIEGAAKEAETDAMKRALMTFGYPFGLALYDKEKANVGYPKREFSFKKADLDAFMAEFEVCDTMEKLEGLKTRANKEKPNMAPPHIAKVRTAIANKQTELTNDELDQQAKDRM